MGASRWLDANMLAGTSMNSAMAKVTIVFSRFIKFSSGIEFVDVTTSWAWLPGRGATPHRFTNSFVYCIKYAPDRRLDLDRAGRTPPTLTLLLISHASRMQGQRTGVSALHEI